MEEFYIINVNDIMMPNSLSGDSLRFKSFHMYSNVLNDQVTQSRLRRTFYQTNGKYLGEGETILKKNEDGSYVELYSGIKVNVVQTVYDRNYSDLHQDFEATSYYITQCPEMVEELSPLYIDSHYLRKIETVEQGLNIVYSNKNTNVLENVVNPLSKRFEDGQQLIISQMHSSQKHSK